MPEYQIILTIQAESFEEVAEFAAGILTPGEVVDLEYRKFGEFNYEAEVTE